MVYFSFCILHTVNCPCHSEERVRLNMYVCYIQFANGNGLGQIPSKLSKTVMIKYNLKWLTLGAAVSTNIHSAPQHPPRHWASLYCWISTTVLRIMNKLIPKHHFLSSKENGDSSYSNNWFRIRYLLVLNSHLLIIVSVNYQDMDSLICKIDSIKIIIQMNEKESIFYPKRGQIYTLT